MVSGRKFHTRNLCAKPANLHHHLEKISQRCFSALCHRPLPGTDTTSDWPVLRQGQKDACNALANCAYSVNIDLGEKGNIHPQDKKPAAERAAYAMLNLVYGKNMPRPAVFQNASKNNGTITVEFQNAKGLKLKNNTGVGFEISTDGRNWTPVDPAKVSVSGSTVRISGAAGAAHIRYAWASWPAGLPL